jgi:hypothetical protein
MYSAKFTRSDIVRVCNHHSVSVVDFEELYVVGTFAAPPLSYAKPTTISHKYDHEGPIPESTDNSGLCRYKPIRPILCHREGQWRRSLHNRDRTDDLLDVLTFRTVALYCRDIGNRRTEEPCKHLLGDVLSGSFQCSFQNYSPIQ